jgi:MEDS: MEthanogen/methylotroph, DcmR Sensory domain
VSPWERLLEKPQSRGHFVQLYAADEPALAKNVALYLWGGLRRGEGVLALAAPEHQELFCRQLDALGAETQRYLQKRQVVFGDARVILSRWMARGKPDWHLFEGTVTAAMQEVSPASASGGLRVYGEVVGLLWEARQFAAAVRVEQFWNRLLEQVAFSLYCAYPVDVFGQEFRAGSLDGVLCTHTHLLPAWSNRDLESALQKGMEEILGSQADAVRARIRAKARPSWSVMPDAEAMVLWVRENMPGQADDILASARRHLGNLLPNPQIPESA